MAKKQDEAGKRRRIDDLDEEAKSDDGLGLDSTAS